METERIKEQLKRLSLHRIAEIFEEVLAKTDRSINARIAKAKFTQIKGKGTWS